MSKIRYLVLMVILVVVGFFMISQLMQTNHWAIRLLGVEIARNIQFHIGDAYRELKRFPNSREELEHLVLNHLQLGVCSQEIVIRNFLPGNERVPAFFQVCIQGSTTYYPLTLNFRYYGCEYHRHFFYKGKLFLE